MQKSTYISSTSYSFNNQLRYSKYWQMFSPIKSMSWKKSSTVSIKYNSLFKAQTSSWTLNRQSFKNEN